MSSITNNSNYYRYLEFNSKLIEAHRHFDAQDMRTIENQNRLVKLLKSAYTQLHYIAKEMGHVPTDLAPQASFMFYLYGRCTIVYNRKIAKRIFLLALNLRLLHLKPENTPIKTLQECSQLQWVHLNLTRKTEKVSIESSIAFIENISEATLKDISTPKPLLVSQLDDKTAKITSYTISKSSALAFTDLLKCLGECYKHLAEYIKPSAKKISHLENIYTLCLHIWNEIDPKNENIDIRWNKVDFIHRMSRFLFAQTNPNALLEELKTLDPILSLLEGDNSDRAVNEKVEIFNIKHKETASLIKKASSRAEEKELAIKCQTHIDNAFRIACRHQNFDPHMKHLILNNKLANEILYFTITGELREKGDLQFGPPVLLQFIKGQDYNHFLHAKFALTTAKCAICLEDYVTAKERLQLTKEICDKFPEQTANIRAEILSIELRHPDSA